MEKGDKRGGLHERIEIVPLEFQEQEALVQWLNLKRLTFFAIPNGGYRNKPEASGLIRQGVMAGVPDLLILNSPPSNPQSKGTFVEMKRRSGSKISELQTEWHQKVREHGYEIIVGYGWESAVAQLEGLGY